MVLGSKGTDYMCWDLNSHCFPVVGDGKINPTIEFYILSTWQTLSWVCSFSDLFLIFYHGRSPLFTTKSANPRNADVPFLIVFQNPPVIPNVRIGMKGPPKGLSPQEMFVSESGSFQLTPKNPHVRHDWKTRVGPGEQFKNMTP